MTVKMYLGIILIEIRSFDARKFFTDKKSSVLIRIIGRGIKKINPDI